MIKDTFGAERLGDFSIENSIVTLSAVFITVAVIIFLAENISNFYKAFRYR